MRRQAGQRFEPVSFASTQHSKGPLVLEKNCRQGTPEVSKLGQFPASKPPRKVEENVTDKQMMPLRPAPIFH